MEGDVETRRKYISVDVGVMVLTWSRSRLLFFADHLPVNYINLKLYKYLEFGYQYHTRFKQILSKTFFILQNSTQLNDRNEMVMLYKTFA